MKTTIRKLWVLYDNRCGMCSRLRLWVVGQPAFVAMQFIAAGSPKAVLLFPTLQRSDQAAEELLVIDDEGGVYSNDDAWLMCLWGLEEYREWAIRLAASPLLKGMARQAYSMVSRQRHGISAALGILSEAELERRLRQVPLETCPLPARVAPGYFSDRV